MQTAMSWLRIDSTLWGVISVGGMVRSGRLGGRVCEIGDGENVVREAVIVAAEIGCESRGLGRRGNGIYVCMEKKKVSF